MTRVLLVDDGENNRLTLSALLEDEGFEVDTAGSFSEARARLAAPLPQYDVALVDQKLGDGLGTDLLPLLRSHSKDAKLVLMSGSRPTEHADAYFEKGRSLTELMALIHGLLGQQAR